MRSVVRMAIGAASAVSMATVAHAYEPPIIELGIADIRTAMLEDGASCATLIQRHIARIQAYDGQLNSIIALDPDAMRAARAIDALPQADKRKLPLLCTPLLVKDNIDVLGMPTTGGTRALLGNVARRDAPAVAALRRAGAIPLAKTNMSEFAFNFQGASALGGRTRNPYNVLLSAGGSSSGNGAALAASFGVVALGTDTSGSLRVPSAVAGLVGLRPTHGLLDNSGVVPLSASQDVVGPMCRTADDCLKVMQVLVAPATEVKQAPALAGIRVGVVRALFPKDSRSAPFMQVVEALIGQMRRAGVEVEEVDVDDVQVIAGNQAPAGQHAKFASRSAFDFPAEMAAYLRGRNGAIASYAALVERMTSLNAQALEGDRALDDVQAFDKNYNNRASDERYRINGEYRDAFVRSRLDKAFSGDGHAAPFDFLMYPSVQGFDGSATNGPDTGGTHRLSAYSGYPAVAFPAGWAKPGQWQPVQSVGIELLGKTHTDLALLQFVQLLQKQLPARVIPALPPAIN